MVVKAILTNLRFSQNIAKALGLYQLLNLKSVSLFDRKANSVANLNELTYSENVAELKSS